MARILFIGKKTSVSQTIYELVAQLKGIELSSKWLNDLEIINTDFSNQDLCILNLSDWESGNMSILKTLINTLGNVTPLLVIDTYKDQHLINRIIDLGAADYIEQQKVAASIEDKIHQLLIK